MGIIWGLPQNRNASFHCLEFFGILILEIYVHFHGGTSVISPDSYIPRV